MATLPPDGQSPEAAPEGPPSDAPAVRQSTPFLVLQFFVFPLSIVAVCVAVFVVFGLIASEGKGPRQYLDEVRTGSANRRWQAAFELTKVLQAGKDPALKDPRFVDEAVRTFRESGADDPRVRRYLALALGRLGDPRAVPALLEAAREAAPDGPRSDPETQVYAVWALGALGDAQAVPALLELTRSEDPGVRKTAVHALGSFPGEATQAALAAALGDPVEDVRWNAAVALARRRDPAAAPVLLEMLDRAHIDAIPGMSEEQRVEALVQAIEAAAVVPDGRLRPALERLRDGDASLRVREAARTALGGRPGPSPSA
ncbi:MAG TPA: HEAT repeat domain-containing protein [Vicinamibacteria bacterium]|nr:HEAT repeat domain-containing protein [Vicinamibacteria bacterium]